MKSFKAWGPMFVGKQMFAGSWGRYLVGKKKMSLWMVTLTCDLGLLQITERVIFLKFY